MLQARSELDGPIITIVLIWIKTNQVNKLGTDLKDANKINMIKCTLPKGMRVIWSHMLILQMQQVPHPLLDQSDWSSKDWDRDKAKAREQNSIIKFDIPWPIRNNPTLDQVASIPFKDLTIQTDGPDKKALEVLTTPIAPLEQGAVETAPKDGQTKLDTVPKEEEEQAAERAKDIDRRRKI